MLTKRMITIIKILSRENRTVEGTEICMQLGISTRTLRNDIKTINSERHKNGFNIDTLHRKGYILSVEDEGKFHHFIHNQMRETTHNQTLIPNNQEDRIHYIIRKLLVSEEYIKADDLSDEMFISRATLNNDMKLVRERLHFFSLDIESVPAHGMCIVGTEFHKRSCIAMYFFGTDSRENELLDSHSNENTKQKISSILLQTINKTSLRLTDIGFENLVTHIMITIFRLEEGSFVADSSRYIDVLNSDEYEVSELLCTKFEEAFNVKFPIIERIYIAMHLAGKKVSQYLDDTSISLDSPLFQDMCTIINNRFAIDFSEDIDLFTALSLHFQPMKSRLEYGLHIKNPLLEQIKTENTHAFEISLVAAEVIKKHWGFTLDESETGYIALHFALALERYRTFKNKKNILIVCASGVGSSQILYHKVKQKFSSSINNLEVSELYALESIDLSEFDLILSSVPISTKVDLPIIYVQYFLDDQDISNVKTYLDLNSNEFESMSQYFRDDLFFTNLQGDSRENVILELCKKVRNVEKLPVNFEEEVIKRERYALTEYGNSIAIPHPMKPLSKRTFVAIGILKRPILWGKTYVKYVFLLSVSTNKNESLQLFHEVLSSLALDKDAMLRFEKKPTFETLKEILNEISEQETSDSQSIFK